jgi:hypothetical protein
MATTDRFTEGTGSPGTTITRTDMDWGYVLIQGELTEKYHDIFWLTSTGENSGSNIFGGNVFPMVEVWLSDRGNPDVFTQVHSSGMVFWDRNTGWLGPDEGYIWSLVNTGSPNFYWYVRVSHGGGYDEDLMGGSDFRRTVWLHIIGEPN